jgi:endonuclease/exonuclease/phosphatase family metal-dependent hydrolase
MRGIAGLLLLVLSLVAGTVHAAPARPLAVVSFNAFHGGPVSGLTGNAGELDRRLAMVARELRTLEVDVVGLQEASAGRWRGNVAERLATELGLYWVHAPTTALAMPFAPLGRALVWVMGFDEGPAILSRFPIRAQAISPLPRCLKYFDPRVLLRVELETPWGTLQVYSTHTSHDACQARAVADEVLRHRNRLPAIVMGDFNAGEGTPWMAALRRDAGFVDAFRAVHPGAPGFTVWQRVDAPTSTVERRVDYVFIVPGREVSGHVVGSQVVLDTPDRGTTGTLWPSDHYGVLAQVDLASASALASGATSSSGTSD